MSRRLRAVDKAPPPLPLFGSGTLLWPLFNLLVQHKPASVCAHSECACLPPWSASESEVCQVFGKQSDSVTQKKNNNLCGWCPMRSYCCTCMDFMSGCTVGFRRMGIHSGKWWHHQVVEPVDCTYCWWANFLLYYDNLFSKSDFQWKAFVNSDTFLILLHSSSKWNESRRLEVNWMTPY